MPLGALNLWPRRKVRPVATLQPAGYFGKVPTHGDFVSNRLDRPFRDALDRWLRAGIRTSQEALGQAWLPAFLAAPTWRFVLDGDVAGRWPAVGVLAPSVDRVGRYFPLIVAVQLQEPVDPAVALKGCEAWFAAAARLVRSAAGEAFDLRAFDAEAERLDPPLVATDAPRGAAGTSAWGAAGRDRLAFRGLPHAEAFSLLIASVPAEPPPASSPDLPVEAPRRPFALVPGVETHAGTRRLVNADAWFAAPCGDLFALADGVLDDRPSAAAALQAMSALAGISAPFALSDLVAEAKGRLGTVHARLRAQAKGTQPPQASVVALAAKGDRFAVIWAGDARCYLLHAGTLRLLSQDHVEIGIGRRVARTVGGPGPLGLQIAQGILHDADRFLLCSGPVARAVPPQDLSALLQDGAADEAARAIVQDCLIGGTADNVTALVVDVVSAAVAAD